MKLQLQHASLRLRLSEAEFARLLAGEAVENRTPLPGGVAVQRVLAVEASDAVSLDGGPERLLLRVPLALLAAYAARLPCREGIEASVALGSGDALALCLEVDVRDSVRTRGPRRG